MNELPPLPAHVAKEWQGPSQSPVKLYDGEQMQAYARAALAAQPGAVGEWKRVPVEPTEAMIAAANKLDWSSEDCDGTVHNVWNAMLAAAPTEAKPAQQDAVDADDPLQGAVDWLLQADGEFFCVATVQRTLRIGYNRANRLSEVAKERAAISAKKGGQ